MSDRPEKLTDPEPLCYLICAVIVMLLTLFMVFA